MISEIGREDEGTDWIAISSSVSSDFMLSGSCSNQYCFHSGSEDDRTSQSKAANSATVSPAPICEVRLTRSMTTSDRLNKPRWGSQ